MSDREQELHQARVHLHEIERVLDQQESVPASAPFAYANMHMMRLDLGRIAMYGKALEPTDKKGS